MFRRRRPRAPGSKEDLDRSKLPSTEKLVNISKYLKPPTRLSANKLTALPNIQGSNMLMDIMNSSALSRPTPRYKSPTHTMIRPNHIKESLVSREMDSYNLISHFMINDEYSQDVDTRKENLAISLAKKDNFYEKKEVKFSLLNHVSKHENSANSPRHSSILVDGKSKQPKTGKKFSKVHFGDDVTPKKKLSGVSLKPNLVEVSKHSFHEMGEEQKSEIKTMLNSVNNPTPYAKKTIPLFRRKFTTLKLTQQHTKARLINKEISRNLDMSKSNRRVNFRLI